MAGNLAAGFGGDGRQRSEALFVTLVNAVDGSSVSASAPAASGISDAVTGKTASVTSTRKGLNAVVTRDTELYGLVEKVLMQLIVQNQILAQLVPNGSSTGPDESGV